MTTIGKLARRFGLSRSTLLYYDRIGLLKPSGRTPANYRVYEPDDVRRLEKICRFREAGLDLRTIAGTLSASVGSLADTLERQVDLLNRKIQGLRGQQHLIVGLLRDSGREDLPVRVIDKESWVRLLRSAGMDDDGMAAWHRAFEDLSPGAHRHFLASLGIPEDEVEAIRRWSRAWPRGGSADDLPGGEGGRSGCGNRDGDLRGREPARQTGVAPDPACVFCVENVKKRIFEESDHCIAIRDGYPVTEGHSLVIPRRHVADYFDLTDAERRDADRLMKNLKRRMQGGDPRITGFNMGVNCGESAGQTVFHAHVHLIPRRKGDTESPRGGVRGVIPGRRGY